MRSKVDFLQADAIELRVDAIELRVDAIELRVDAIELRGDAIKLQGVAIELRVDAIKLRVDAIKLQGDAIKLQGDATTIQEVGLRLHSNTKCDSLTFCVSKNPEGYICEVFLKSWQHESSVGAYSCTPLLGEIVSLGEKTNNQQRQKD